MAMTGFLNPAIAAVTCGADPSTSINHTDNYILGTADSHEWAMHWPTGLVWNRCAEGQTLNSDGSACTGSAAVTAWNEWAKRYLPRHFGSMLDWRVTTSTGSSDRLVSGEERMAYLSELKTLTEGCTPNPKINRKVFPGTTLSYVWSGSPESGQAPYAWNVRFDSGAIQGSVGSGLPVRLVRGGQWFELLDPVIPKSAVVGTVYTFAPVTLKASELSGTAWGGARITGDGNPEFQVNGTGAWMTEAIVRSGDSIAVRTTAGAVGSEHIAALLLRSGKTTGTTDDVSNGGTEDTEMRETAVAFRLAATAAPLNPTPVPVDGPWALALLTGLLALLGFRAARKQR